MKVLTAQCTLVGLLLFCSSSFSQKTISQIKFIDKYVIPHNLIYKKTTVGGLSGIDYNPKKEEYFLISDDRSDINPARFYTAKILFNGSRIDTVMFTGMHFLLQQNGAYYPNKKQDKQNTPDPESIRYNATTNELIWTSEGERIVTAEDTVLASPTINIITANGLLTDSIPIPTNLYMHATAWGPRRNGVLEGGTFNKEFTKYYTNVEEPLYQDGERADTKPNNAWIRIYEFNVSTKKHTAEYAYHLDPIPYAANPPDAFKINGIPDILWLNEKQLIVLERAFSTGRQQCTIKVFLADMDGATNVSNYESLKKDTAFKPMQKKLLLNMDDLGFFVDNIEGVTFGPTLPNGHASLIFIADDNFSEAEQSQVLLFEVIP
ncbi:MAG: esterase-like activity of phytase family protein [Sphingobacteriia bacterium]|nr:esterase-like activity of phytase family protein [Sphingobacteriia bacterium]